MDDRIDRYKGYRINESEAHDLLIRCVDTGKVPVTQIVNVLNEWRNPRNEIF